MRTERMVGTTKIITDPTPADILPFLNKKRITAHVMHPYGSSSGILERMYPRKNIYRIWTHGRIPGDFAYVRFEIEKISELNFIPGQQNIMIHIRR